VVSELEDAIFVRVDVEVDGTGESVASVESCASSQQTLLTGTGRGEVHIAFSKPLVDIDGVIR
jgi:hypothetical protein